MAYALAAVKAEYDRRQLLHSSVTAAASQALHTCSHKREPACENGPP
jgi:hypothetical protein